ncbi:MAG: hypothetical protein ACLVGL_03065 [Waltera sp.]
MDHPENKASGIIDVQRLMEILKRVRSVSGGCPEECDRTARRQNE